MLTFRQLDDLPDAVTEIMSEAEQAIISDMVKRIARMGTVSDATLYQLERLEAIGAEHDFIVRTLTKALNLTEEQLTLMFDEAITRTLASDDAIYRAAGYSPILLKDNPVMQQIIQAGLDRTMNEFRNLTGTIAKTATLQFENALDKTWMEIVTGGRDYKSAIKVGIRTLTQNGLGAIRYPSGHVDYLDVAFRRAAMTGATQCAGHIQSRRMDELGVNIVETSSHAGARSDGSRGPGDHAYWQGRRFFWSEKGGENTYELEDFIQTTGYETGEGLCGWNCRHSYYPIPDPEAPTARTQAELDVINNRTVTYNGEEMSLYDATQKQRSIERQIRRWKREESALGSAGEDTTAAHGKVRQWQAAQRDFIDQTGLRRDYFRERAGAQLTA